VALVLHRHDTSEVFALQRNRKYAYNNLHQIKITIVFSYVHGMHTSRTAACKTSGLINEATGRSVALDGRKPIVC